MSRVGQQGMALIQVLLLVAMLSILLLLMVANTQQQQQQVLAIQSQLSEQFDLYSHANDLLFGLLTEPPEPVVESIASRTEPAKKHVWNPDWNFYAQAFSFKGGYGAAQHLSQARLTNLNSLINLQYTSYGLARLLRALGYRDAEADALARAVQEWQQPSTAVGAQLYSERSETLVTLPIQHGYELAFVPGWSEQLAQQVTPYVTVVGIGMLNEAYMPDNMLGILLSRSQADTIRQLRAEGRFSREQFSTLTGIEADEFRTLYPGPDFRVEVWHEHNPAFVRVLEVSLSPYKKEPLALRYQGWGD